MPEVTGMATIGQQESTGREKKAETRNHEKPGLGVREHRARSTLLRKHQSNDRRATFMFGPKESS